ncbi:MULTISPECIES: hypothetical protein [Methylomicrobium]|uniref:Uncharacterized protein n=1 Tax=Methylomicrobium album BG8 TaxID=686340 RepID=H8GLQ3_METAL|nr:MULTISPECIES: hypothetical protein [Methylomicrobium]EIC30580.1 hypothetical protein Metal_2894 [Methylomicrobium album BG8]
MTPNAKKPPERGGAGGFRNNSEQRHFIKTPPYGKQLNLNGQNLIVCTGSGAWERAKSPTWFPGCKVALPFGDDPTAYAWSVAAGHDVLIVGFGDLEPVAVIAKLAGLLLAAGAGLVLYAPKRGPMMRIDRRKGAA